MRFFLFLIIILGIGMWFELNELGLIRVDFGVFVWVIEKRYLFLFFRFGFRKM